MTDIERKLIVVTGATGLQGSAITRHLLKDGWRVRALTRQRTSRQAQALATLGADVVEGDMVDKASLRLAFAGVYGVYSVQNPFVSGPDGEIRQGTNVADIAAEAGVQHLVYGSAGTGQTGTGIPSWETKLRIEHRMQELNLPLTILRPMAFMELMTHQKFFPAVSTWHIMPKLMGLMRPVGWLSTDDLGAIVVKIFAAPDQFLGRDLPLVSDVQSLEACRTTYREVMGRFPRRFPLPAWLFQRFGFVGQDLTTMWRWLRSATFDLDTTTTRAILPGALTVRDWLSRQKAENSAAG